MEDQKQDFINHEENVEEENEFLEHFPLEERSPKINRFWATLIVTLVGVFIIGGATFAWYKVFNRVDPNLEKEIILEVEDIEEDMITYTNEEYGFEFDHDNNECNSIVEKENGNPIYGWPDSTILLLNCGNGQSYDMVVQAWEDGNQFESNCQGYCDPNIALQTSDVYITVTNNNNIEIVNQIIKTFELIESTNWLTYTNTTYNYSIDYPKDWEFGNTTDFATGFRPTSMQSDYKWGVLAYDKSVRTKQDIISSLGSQFSPDREVVTNELIINGVSATRVIVTTSRMIDWYFESIIIEYGDYIFHISNGAVEDDSFEKFYNSFKLSD